MALGRRPSRIVKACAVCGDPMPLPPSLAFRRRTCSRACRDRLLSRERRGRGNPNFRGALRRWTCAFCGRTFADAYYVRRRKYCCRECRRLDETACHGGRPRGRA